MNTTFFLFILTIFSITVVSATFTLVDAEESFHQANTANQKKIVLIGASGIYALDSQYISESLLSFGIKSDVSSLGVNMDLPSRRVTYLDDVISLHPDIVVNQHGFRLGINDGTHDQRYGCQVIRPEHITYQKALSVKDRVDKRHFGLTDSYDTNSVVPNYNLESNVIQPITPTDEIQVAFPDVPIDLCSELLEKELTYYKEMLRQLKSHDVEVITFVPPFPRPYLNQISDLDEEYFLFLSGLISFEHDVAFYDISHKYENNDIFRDFIHIARNPNSLVYSDDIIDMVLISMKKQSTSDIESFKVGKWNNFLMDQWCNDSKQSQKNNAICAQESHKIPSWIKTNAGWWANDQIDDGSFVEGMQYLIKKNILKIS